MKYLVGWMLLFSAFSCNSFDETIKTGNYDNPQKALLVIDMQFDYLDENGKYPIEKSQINDLIETINNIIVDFNEKDYQIIYLRNIFRKNDLRNVFRNFAVVEGTAGAEIDPRINIISDNIFDKYTPNAFSNQTFENFLIENQIKELYVCGVMADQCVYETALGAFDRNYTVNYLSKAVGSSSVKNIDKAIVKLRKKGINIVP
jgi:nicotinamidase-related amidase